MSQDNSGSGAFVIGFVVGAAAGIAAALMMAPRSGSETVGQIRERGEKMKTFSSELGGQARDRASGQLQKAQETALSRGRGVLEQTQSKVQGAIERLEEGEQSDLPPT